MTSIGRCWDHEDCPRDDCDGEVQQQDRFNVMCLSCEAVWTHVKTDTTHYLQTVDFETVAEKPVVMTDGGHDTATTTTDRSEASSSLFDRWMGKAATNIDQWGVQDEETLLLAMQEELGELTQAHLEATHEDGDPERIAHEMDDLGALLLQLHVRLDQGE